MKDSWYEKKDWNNIQNSNVARGAHGPSYSTDYYKSFYAVTSSTVFAILPTTTMTATTNAININIHTENIWTGAGMRISRS